MTSRSMTTRTIPRRYAQIDTDQAASIQADRKGGNYLRTSEVPRQRSDDLLPQFCTSLVAGITAHLCFAGSKGKTSYGTIKKLKALQRTCDWQSSMQAHHRKRLATQAAYFGKPRSEVSCTLEVRVRHSLLPVIRHPQQHVCARHAARMHPEVRGPRNAVRQHIVLLVVVPHQDLQHRGSWAMSST